jgi:hypothetical protein
VIAFRDRDARQVQICDRSALEGLANCADQAYACY